MVSLTQMKDLYRMQRDAKKIKKELRNIHIEAEADGVKVIVTAEQEIVSIDVNPTVAHGRIGGLLKDALNRALGKAQVIAAEKMKPIMSQMGMPTDSAL